RAKTWTRQCAQAHPAVLDVGQRYGVVFAPKKTFGSVHRIERPESVSGVRLAPVYPIANGLTGRVGLEFTHVVRNACEQRRAAVRTERGGEFLADEARFRKGVPHTPRNKRLRAEVGDGY